MQNAWLFDKGEFTVYPSLQLFNVLFRCIGTVDYIFVFRNGRIFLLVVRAFKVVQNYVYFLDRFLRFRSF